MSDDIKTDVAVLQSEMRACQAELKAIRESIQWMNRLMLAGFFGAVAKLVFDSGVL